MSDELQAQHGRAVELLELHDRLDTLDEEVRTLKTVLRLTPLVSTVLAAPLLILLFMHEVRFFAAYPSTFVIVLGTIIAVITVERRRLMEEREAIRTRIDRTEDAE